MSAEWLIYYASVAAYVVGGGYPFLQGGSVHRITAAVLLLGYIAELVGCAILITWHIPIGAVCVNFEFGLNLVMGLILMTLALHYRDAAFLAVVILLLAVQIGLNAFVFDDDPAVVKSHFTEAANLLNVAQFTALCLAVARAHARTRPRQAKLTATAPA